jgi:hypothetical protein
MKESKWIDWEIEYCLKNITRKDRTSHTNGVVGVIMKYKGGYEWTGMDAYITFSDEDIERYLQIANYGTMPIS